MPHRKSNTMTKNYKVDSAIIFRGHFTIMASLAARLASFTALAMSHSTEQTISMFCMHSLDATRREQHRVK